MFAELKRRRVLPLVGVYLGAAWVGVEFSNFMVERYHLSQGWVDALIAMVALMLPAVVVFAYNHGAPGPDRWTALERYLLPINLLIAITVAVLVFGDRPVGAMADTLERADEDGQVLSRTVAREGYRQRLLLFALSATADQANQKLALALPKLIEASLSGDPFIEPESVTGNATLLARLRRSGAVDGSQVPTALRRRVAEEARYEWMLSGQLDGAAGGWKATLDLAATAPGAVEQRIVVQGARLTDLADAASSELRQIMARQIGSPDFASSATLDEQFSANDQAVAAFLQAFSAHAIDNDQRTASAHLDRAIELDPSFARAYMLRAVVAVEEGRQGDAQKDLAATLKYDYRLDDPAKFRARSISYGLSNQPQKRLAVLRLWTELHPASAQAQIDLAHSLRWFGGDPEATIQAFRRVLELSPSETQIHLTLAELLAAQGKLGEARAAAEAFAAAEPKSESGPLWLGRLALPEGDFGAAVAHAERGALLRPDLVGPLLDLAEYAALQGQWEQMEAQLEAARGVAGEATQEATVACVSAQLYLLPGWRERALAQADHCAAVASAVVSPLSLAMDVKLPFSGLRTEMLGLQATLADIEQTLTGFDGEMRKIGAFARMFAYLHAEQADQAEAELGQLVEVLRAWNRQDLDYLVSFARGRIAMLRGEVRSAAEALAAGAAQYERSSHRFLGAAGFLSVHIAMLDFELRALLADHRVDQALQRGERAIGQFPGAAAIKLSYAEAAAAAGRAELAAGLFAEVERLWAGADERAIPRERIDALSP